MSNTTFGLMEIKSLEKNNKTKHKAKKDFFPESLIFSFCLKPPLELKWYLAFFLDKFSIMNNANINNNRKKDN